MIKQPKQSIYYLIIQTTNTLLLTNMKYLSPSTIRKNQIKKIEKEKMNSKK